MSMIVDAFHLDKIEAHESTIRSYKNSMSFPDIVNTIITTSTSLNPTKWPTPIMNIITKFTYITKTEREEEREENGHAAFALFG